MKKNIVKVLLLSSISFLGSCSENVLGNPQQESVTSSKFIFRGGNFGGNINFDTSEIIKEDRELSSFSSIETNSNVSVIVTDGDYDGKVEVETHKDAIKNVITEVSNNVLHVSYKSDSNSKNLKVLKITLPHKNLKSIKTLGNSKIDVNSLQTVESISLNSSQNSKINVNPLQNIESVSLNSSQNSKIKLNVISNIITANSLNNSKIELTGNSKNLNIKTFSNSSVLAENLKANDSELESKDNSKITVWSIDKLIASSYSNSSIKYKNVKGLQTKLKKNGHSRINKF